MQEKNKIGLFSIVLLGINGIIGSGIFLLPGKVVALAGNWTPFVYLFSTILVMAIAWCFAQCASLFDRNGGAYVYARAAFGDFIGFEIGMMRWALSIITWSAMAAGFVTALGALYPPIQEDPIRTIILLTLIGGLGIANIQGVGMMKYLNNIATIAKVLPLLFFVLVGIFFIDQSHLLPKLASQSFEIGSFGAAMLLIFYAFGGIESLTVAAEEMRNPTKNLPIALMIAISFCSVLYFLIQMIAMGVLGPVLAYSEAPLADAAELFAGSIGKWLVSLSTLISIGGINIAASFTSPRTAVALAQDELIPAVIAKKGKEGTPYIAILITVAATSLLALSGSFIQLVTISVVARIVQYTATILSLFVFHKKNMLPHQPFKNGLKFSIPLFALGSILWLLLQATLQQLTLGLGALVLGLPLYVLQKKNSLSFSSKPLI